MLITTTNLILPGTGVCLPLTFIGLQVYPGTITIHYVDFCNEASGLSFNFGGKGLYIFPQ